MLTSSSCLALLCVSAAVIGVTTGDLPRLPNGNYAGYGYDVFKGNPHNDITDPGFRSPVILLEYNQHKPSNDGKYQIPDGTEVLHTVSCRFESETSEINGSSSYQKELSQDAELKVDALSVKPFGAKFTASDTFKEINIRTSNYSRRYVSSVSLCVSYKVNINYEYGSFQVTPEFARAVKSLPVGRKVDDKPYMRFVTTYGTHFTSTLTMGAKVVQLSEFDSRNWKKMHDTGLNVKLAGSASYVASVNGHLTTDSQKKLAEQFNSMRSSVKTSYLGSRPPADGKQSTWVSASADTPYPVKYVLVALSELITESYFPGEKSDVLAARRRKLDQIMDVYCKHIPGCGIPKPDTLQISTVAVRSQIHGTRSVSCQPGFSLLSCGNDFPQNDDGAEDFKRYVIPESSTSCKCHAEERSGAVCVAWCSSVAPKNFEIKTSLVTAYRRVLATCPGNKKVIGCHFRPREGATEKLHRQYYPKPEGDACICRDAYDGQCVATCASNIERYEVMSAYGPGRVTVQCSPGNYVLGCGLFRDESSGRVNGRQMYYASSQDSCTCFDPTTVTCYAICGVIGQS